MLQEKKKNQPSLSVAGLVRGAKEGDPEALETLARRFLGACYAVALSIVSQPEDAEDAAQDGFVLAMERLDRCRHPDRFAGWLMSIVRNRARDVLRYRNRRKSPGIPSPETEPEKSAISNIQERIEHRSQLLQALSFLSETQREIVLLHSLEGWSHGEIASTMGISEGMSRQHLLASRLILQKVLTSKQQTEDRE